MKHLIAILGALFALVFAVPAQASVHVRVASDTPQGPVLSTNGYTVTVTSDEVVDLHSVKLLLPGHGAPPIEEDVYGQPKDTDPDTQFDVTNLHGASQDGRWITWAVFDTLLPGGALTFRLDVQLPPAEAYFQAGATVTLDSHDSIDATKRGAQIWAHQDTASLHTWGEATIDGHDVTINWHIKNGTDESLTVDTERFGVRAGAAYEGSSLDPVFKIRHIHSLGIIWHHSIRLDPGEQVDHTVYLTTTCGAGQVGARLRVYSGALLAGTGDAGPHWKLPDC